MSEEQGIADGDYLWRWVTTENPQMMRYDSVTNEQLGPSSAAFKPHEDGTSVYVRRILDDYDVGPAGISDNPQNSVWELEAKKIREQELDVIPDAWPQGIPNPNHPRNAAHALIVGWDDLSRKQVDKKAKALARLASCVFHPPKRSH
ncbi:hypothetical protein G3I18_02850 [Actinospica acidiphila]|uniref:Uncharacterized protein n=1 Tax=Actinospica acidiphila TaxID=304899 RepID=A0A9X5CH82_9ACTN|nr:hypothetical protein [Actinospica acidiphila]NEC47527.1 hypothetical protein [Actinospica acidiphila]